MEYWSNGVRDRWSNEIMREKEKSYRNLSGLIRNTPILQYSSNPLGFQLVEQWSHGKNGVMECWSNGKSQRKIGLAFPLPGIMEDEKE